MPRKDSSATSRATLPTSPVAITPPKHSSGTSARRYNKPIERPAGTRQIADTIRASPKSNEGGPCEGCSHRDRCAQGSACRALELFVNTGRISEVAPRQPNR
jgi:hypothetical protein